MFLGKLPHQSDLIEALTATACANGIGAGAVQVIGALQRASIGFYDQGNKTYRTIHFDRPLEIASGMGNISLRDGNPFVHLHLTLADEEGKAFGGHALEGCIVFAAEFVLVPLTGAAPVRTFDETTGLFLWEQKQYPAPGARKLSPELERALLHP